MYSLNKKIKNLKTKIYKKQQFILNKMYKDNILHYNDYRIKNLVNEVTILDFILEQRINDYTNLKESYWN
jgi:hypothetical protein